MAAILAQAGLAVGKDARTEIVRRVLGERCKPTRCIVHRHVAVVAVTTIALFLPVRRRTAKDTGARRHCAQIPRNVWPRGAIDQKTNNLRGCGRYNRGKSPASGNSDGKFDSDQRKNPQSPVDGTGADTT